MKSIEKIFGYILFENVYYHYILHNALLPDISKECPKIYKYSRGNNIDWEAFNGNNNAQDLEVTEEKDKKVLERTKKCMLSEFYDSMVIVLIG